MYDYYTLTCIEHNEYQISKIQVYTKRMNLNNGLKVLVPILVA